MLVLTEKTSVETYINEKDDTKKYCFKLETESGTLYANAESRLHRTHWMSSFRKTTESLVEEEREFQFTDNKTRYPTFTES